MLHLKQFDPSRPRPSADPALHWTGTNKVPHRCAAILIGLAAASSLAGESQTSVTVSLHQVPVSYVGLGTLVVELGTATLPDLVETVGTGVVRHNGIQDHDGRGYEVCLSYPGGLVRFTADSEMGGPKRTVTDFLVEATAKSPADCPALPERFTPLRVDGWLSIDSSRIAVEEHLQNSAGRGYASVLYEFSGVAPGNCANDDLVAFDITASLEITYRDSAIFRIKGHRLTTC